MSNEGNHTGPAAGTLPPRRIPNGVFRSPMNWAGVAVLFWIFIGQFVISTLALMIPLIVRLPAQLQGVDAEIFSDPEAFPTLIMNMLLEVQSDPLFLSVAIFLSPFAALLAALLTCWISKTKISTLFTQKNWQSSQNLQRLGGGTFANIIFIVLAGAALGQVLVLLLEIFLSVFGLGLTVPEALSTLPSPDQPFYMLLTVLGFCVGAPVAEEMLFRGIILQKLRVYGNGFAIVVSALLFALVHGNPIQFPGPFFLGLVFGVVTLHTRSLLPAIVLHAVNNTVAVVMDYALTIFQVSDEMVLNAVFWGIYLLFLAVAVVFSLFNRKGLKPLLATWRHRPKEPLPEGIAAGWTDASSIPFLRWRWRYRWLKTSWSMYVSVGFLLLLFLFMTFTLLVSV